MMFLPTVAGFPFWPCVLTLGGVVVLALRSHARWYRAPRVLTQGAVVSCWPCVSRSVVQLRWAFRRSVQGVGPALSRWAVVTLRKAATRSEGRTGYGLRSLRPRRVPESCNQASGSRLTVAAIDF